MNLRTLISCFVALLALAAFARNVRAQSEYSQRPRALILEVAKNETPLANRLRATLARAGYRVERRDFDTASASDALSFEAVQLVALPDARTLPHTLHAPMESFLKRGGDLLALGLPAWSRALMKHEGRWIETEEYARTQGAAPVANPLRLFQDVPLERWERSSNQPLEASRYTLETSPQGPILHAVVNDFTSWDTITTPVLPSPFANGTDRTVFMAKGGSNSRVLSVEWRERDESRWIAVVTLTPQWRRYELAPQDFRYYQSNTARGGRGDAFRPENAARLAFGIAQTHGESQTGKHEWWVGNLGTASAQQAPLSLVGTAAPLDGLYPNYKAFRIFEPNVGVRAVAPSLFPMKRVATPQGALFSPHPRPSGAGFAKERRTRFVPLLQAHSQNGIWRGVPGALLLHEENGRYNGGRWAVFGITDTKFLSSPAFQAALQKLAARMRGPLLWEGGSDWYTVFPNRALQIGARISGASTRTSPNALETQIRIVQKASGSAVFMWRRNGKSATLPNWISWTPPDGQRGPWRVEVALRRGGETIDAISHDIHVYDHAARPSFITAARGQFLLNGKPWKAHGVNYMPSSGVARDTPEENTEFELWIGKSPYDPEIVARDLDNMKRLGFNSLSVFIYGGSRHSGNLLDLIRQSQARGFKLNLSLRPGTPIDWGPQWKEIRPIIEQFQLHRSDVIFAYDLAWEPAWGNHEARRAHDSQWTKWVQTRYGNLDAAQRAWNFSPQRDGEKLLNPTDEQVTFDGDWRAMTIDYRRFLADLLRDRYGRARQDVRGIDPNHLVSFRMQETSNPMFQWTAYLPYDFPGLAESVDFLTPEGYGRMGDWEKTKPGWFQVEYGRAIAPQLPVVWGEAGVSTWLAGMNEPSPDRLKLQADSLRAFYRMAIASGANGLYHWWSAGGFRTGENSDFGIINPDGTDRPVSRVIRESAAPFLASPAPRPTDAQVGIRLWQHAEGPFGIYREAGPQFWKLVEEGKQPRLVIENP